MSRYLKITGAVVVVLTILGGLAYRSAPVQDALMRTGVAAMLGSAPETFDGLQARLWYVVVHRLWATTQIAPKHAWRWLPQSTFSWSMLVHDHRCESPRLSYP